MCLSCKIFRRNLEVFGKISEFSAQFLFQFSHKLQYFHNIRQSTFEVLGKSLEFSQKNISVSDGVLNFLGKCYYFVGISGFHIVPEKFRDVLKDFGIFDEFQNFPGKLSGVLPVIFKFPAKFKNFPDMSEFFLFV